MPDILKSVWDDLHLETKAMEIVKTNKINLKEVFHHFENFIKFYILKSN